MSISRLIPQLTLAFLLCPSALSLQGADSCANADVVVTGSHAFDTSNCSDTGAPASTSPGTSCAMTGDVWFTFNGIVNGIGEVFTCGTGGFDAGLALYTGNSCGGLTLVECNFNTTVCSGGTNYIGFPAQQGVTYFVQLGADDPTGTTWGQGTLTIIQNGPPPPPPAADHCGNAPLIGPGYTSHFFLSSAASDTWLPATTGSIGACAQVNDIWLRWTAIESGTVVFETCGNASYDTALGVYEGADCASLVLLACNDDAAGCSGGTSRVLVPVVMGRDYHIQIGVGANSPPVHGDATLSIQPGPAGSPGTTYCAPAEINSTGAPANIQASGSRQVAANSVTLSASTLPLNAFGYFLNARDPGHQPLAGGSQGTLCVGGAVGRYNTSVFHSGTAGAAALVLDLNQTPRPTGQVAVAPGETWYFTCWFRDANPGVTSNFSDGVAITFE